MAEIVVRRASGYRVDRRRAYRIFIDGRKCGTIKPGESKTIDVSPGHHELQLRLDWGSSEKVMINLGVGEGAKFACRPRITENSVNLKVGVQGLYWITLGRRRYIDLRPDDPEAPQSGPDGAPIAESLGG
ncbi:MAG TPA: hypothetical protein VKB23_06540 [Solirubrobacterales bacterium]|nr:hypothetical protein [Solirubrobacterales bacterium]